jgi:hypothetical protein
MNAPKVGTCYCGCGKYTGGWWAVGHDQRAVAWLDQLDPEPANRAALVRASRLWARAGANCGMRRGPQA